MSPAKLFLFYIDIKKKGRASLDPPPDINYICLCN